jgi:NAD-dependent deacetylase
MEQLIERAARDLVDSKYAIALTGAGTSTESGIRDFQERSGICTKDPEAERRAYRSYERFLEDPKAWWEERLTSPSLPGDLEKAMPNSWHFRLAEPEKLSILKCLITQNVDALYEKAGAKNLLKYQR